MAPLGKELGVPRGVLLVGGIAIEVFEVSSEGTIAGEGLGSAGGTSFHIT
jgi:hypothetical protein